MKIPVIIMDHKEIENTVVPPTEPPSDIGVLST